MRWIFENLNLIIVIAGAIAWWFNQRAREKAGQDADYDDDGTPEARPKPESFDDPQLAERTRKIREEIQRKIAERRRAGEGYTEPPRPAVEPPYPPPSPEATRPPVVIPIPERRAPQSAEPPVVREVVVHSPRTAAQVGESRRMAELLEQQAALAEQLKQAEEMKVAARRRAEFERTTRDGTVVARQGNRATLLAELHDPAALRRAFIQREILGPPVGLRR